MKSAIVFSCMLMLSGAVPAACGNPEVNDWHGVNLLGMFQWGEADSRSFGRSFTEDRFRWLENWGFNFARLPMDYRYFMATNDWTLLKEDGFKKVDEAVAFGRKHAVHVQICLHRAPGFTITSWDLDTTKKLQSDKEPQDAFIRIWREFARRYRGIPNKELSFNLINEPSGFTEAQYIDVFGRTIDAIRAEDPDRFVMLDGNRVAAYPVAHFFKVPLTGQSFRGYTPHAISHYGAWYIKDQPKSEPSWPCLPGKDDNPASWIWEQPETTVEKWISKIPDGYPRMIGEFGCFNRISHETALKWMEHCLKLWQEKNVGWAIWNLDGQFGFMDSGRTDVQYEDFEGHKLDRKMLELLQRYAKARTTPPLTTRWGEKVTAENVWREYPRPQMVRGDWQSLNGRWEFAVRPAVQTKRVWQYSTEALEPEKYDTEILVPFVPESPLSGVGRKIGPHDRMWYRRKFTWSPKPGKRTLLTFEAVDFRAQVFVNGIEATDVPHECESVPFTLDITDFVKEGENEVKVLAWDPTDDGWDGTGKQILNKRTCFFTTSSGIWGSVWLEEVPEKYIKDYKVITDVDKGTVRFEFDKVEGAGEVKVTHDMPEKFECWCPENPKLYHFTAKYGEDEIKGYFGMRKLEIRKDPKGIAKIALNGKFVYLLGTLDQGWWPDGYLTPPSEDASRWDVDFHKAIGYNTIRKHIKIEPRCFYAHCDKVGIMVMQDIPSWGGDDRQEDNFAAYKRYGYYRRELKAIVDHLKNHPSVVCWIPFNESWGQPDELETLQVGRWLKRYDPSRLVDLASGWRDFRGGWLDNGDNRSPADNAADPVADILDMHQYPGPAILPANPYRATICGECGGIGASIIGHCEDSLMPRVRNWVKPDEPEIRKRHAAAYREFVERIKILAAQGASGNIYTESIDCFWELSGFVTMDRAYERFDRAFMREMSEEIYAAARIDAGEEGGWIQPAAKGPYGLKVAEFRRAAVNEKDIVSAYAKFTAAGVVEFFANGKPVSDDYLKPGYTHPLKVRQECTYDITKCLKLKAGEENVFAAAVSASWSRDRIASRERPGRKCDPSLAPALKAVVVMRHADGTETRIVTDESWRASLESPVTEAGIYEGEKCDARIGVLGEVTRGKDWPKALGNREFKGVTRPFAGPPVSLRRDLELNPVKMSVVKTDEGEMTVVDFGQNASAVPEFTVEAERGTKIVIRHGEMLNESGADKSRGNDGPAGTPYLANLRTSWAGIEYICRGGGEETYRPAFTFFGYRYVGITSDKPIKIKRIVSIPVTSIEAGRDRSYLETDNPRLNRLIANCRWGMYSNYLSVPTDCPQRDERLGWTADTQVFAPAACYFADVKSFLEKWMDDMRDAQSENGCYAQVAPGSWVRGYVTGWTDAGIIVPWTLWRFYGDNHQLMVNYPSMNRYFEYAIGDGRKDAQPYGDWLSYEYGADMEWLKPVRETLQLPRKRVLGHAYRIWTARMMAEMTKPIYKSWDSKYYEKRAAEETELFRRECLKPDGTLKDECDGQTSALFALYLKLLPNEEAVAKTKAALKANFAAHGNRLQTGFLGTSILLDAVTDGLGDVELAYTLLLQDQNPSWLYSVEQGATTIWERWNSYTKEKGFGPVAMNSFNHYAYGAVAGWMFSTMAGIRPETPGFGRIRFAPKPDRRVKKVNAGFMSRGGMIRSSYELKDNVWHWQGTVPAGHSAILELPDGTEHRLGSGEHTASWRGL